jgi:hypothetical protein
VNERPRLTAPPVHPVFFALFPVAFLYRHNIQTVPWPDAVRVAVAVTAGALVLWIILGLVFRDRHRSAFVASGVALLALSFGHVKAGLEYAGPAGNTAVLLAVTAALVAGIVWVALRLGDVRRDITRILNFVALVLFLLGAVPAAISDVRNVAAPKGGSIDVATTRKAAASSKLRDIYYIVPDDYLGAAMKERTGYDNEPFLKALEERGFYVPRKVNTNYPKSYFSLAATLDMEYLKGPKPPTYDEVGVQLEKNRVVRFLRSKGYRWVYFPGWWDPTGMRYEADITYRYTSSSPFTQTFIETTIFGSAVRGTAARESLDRRTVIRRTTLFELDNMTKPRHLRGPVFVFVHLLLPHGPFVFEADGSELSEEVRKSRPQFHNYVEHVKFANARLLKAIDTLQSVPEDERPIILLQSEEGVHMPVELTYDTASSKDLAQPFSTMVAYYTPGVRAEKVLYPSISPVNSFRALLGMYFGADLPLLPDRSYGWTRTHEPTAKSRFVDLTRRVRAATEGLN